MYSCWLGIIFFVAKSFQDTLTFQLEILEYFQFFLYFSMFLDVPQGVFDNTKHISFMAKSLGACSEKSHQLLG